MKPTETDIEKFLREAETARIATLRPSNIPHCVPVWFVNHGVRVLFSTPTNTVKARNIRRNPMIAVVIDRGRALFDLQGVVIEGKALVVGERTTHEWYLQAYGNKYRHNYADVELILNRNRLQLAQGERIIVEIEPRRIVWFDYGKGVRETWRIL